MAQSLMVDPEVDTSQLMHQTKTRDEAAEPTSAPAPVGKDDQGSHLQGVALYNLLGALMLGMLLLGLDINIVATVSVLSPSNRFHDVH